MVPLVRDDKLIEQLTGDDQDRLIERYTEEAVKFIRENQDQPFFLYLPHTAVHTPIHPGEKFRGKSNNGRYGDWVEEVDWSVGRVLDTLRELKLDARTLVIFTSDNGPWLTKGKDGGEAGPLRGGKGSTLEGGVRVPTIAWWPGKIAAGQRVRRRRGEHRPAADLRVAGRRQRALRPEDRRPRHLAAAVGHSRRSRRARPTTTTGATSSKPCGAARGSSPSDRRRKRWARGRRSPDAAAAGVRLYNLDAEIGERTNVAAEHPDVVKRLQALASADGRRLGRREARPGRPACRTGGAAGTADSRRRAEDAQEKPQSPPGRSCCRRTSRSATPSTPTRLPRSPASRSRSPARSSRRAKSGVIVAHGGSAVGYALYLKEGRLVFAVRRAAADITRITSRRGSRGPADDRGPAGRRWRR